MTVQEVSDVCRRGMNILTGSQQQSLKDYVLDDDHWAVRAHLLELRGKERETSGNQEACWQGSWGLIPQTTKKRELRKEVSWPKSHKQAFEDKDIDWLSTCTDPPEDIKSIFPGLYDISPREFDKLHLSGMRSFPDSTFRLFEVSQAMQRTACQNQASVVGTVYPNARFYVSHKCRLMLGLEMMRMQSLWFDDASMASTSNARLKSVAANAFEASCSSAVFFLGFWLLSAQSHQLPVMPLPMQPASAPDSESDDELEGLWGAKRPRLV